MGCDGDPETTNGNRFLSNSNEKIPGQPDATKHTDTVQRTMAVCRTSCRVEVRILPPPVFPVNYILDVVGMVAGECQNRRGDPIHIYGAREDGTLCIIDGMQIPRW